MTTDLDTAAAEGYHRLGLAEKLEQFLYFRHEWLADPEAVQLRRNAHGYWAVLL